MSNALNAGEKIAMVTSVVVVRVRLSFAAVWIVDSVKLVVPPVHATPALGTR